MTTSITCMVRNEENKDEYLIELEYTYKRISEYHNFACDKSDCPLSYAIIMALTDFFDNYNPSSPVLIYVSDLFAFNLLTDYIKRWKQTNWVNSSGKVVNYVDILSGFYDTVAGKNITYKVLFNHKPKKT